MQIRARKVPARDLLPPEPMMGDEKAPLDSVAYAVYIRSSARACLSQLASRRKGVDIYIDILQRRELYKKLQRPDRQSYFTTWTEFCRAPLPFGLGRSAEDIAAIIAEHRDPVSQAETATALNPNGTNQYSKHEDGPTDSRPTTYGSTSAYRTARIARDAPEVLKRMKAGEFKNVTEAERAAGIAAENRRVWLSTNPEKAAEKLLATFTHEYLCALVQAMQEQLATERSKDV